MRNMAPGNEDEYEVLRPYFTSKGWLALSNYEKLRFGNIKQNYEMMIEIGLDVPLPEFMRPKKNTTKRRQVDDAVDGDDEWLPVKKPATWPGKGSARSSSSNRKGTKSATEPKKGKTAEGKSASDPQSKLKRPRRALKVTSKPPDRSYPKRSQPKKCYKEEEVPDDDHFIYCEDCDDFYDASCPKHPLTIIQDVPVGPRCKNKARQSLPNGLAIRESSISGAGFGVFAEQQFNNGVRFGPYTGEIVDGAEAFSSGYAWEICSSGKAVHYVNARNEAKSNWMRYVNCARNENEQNLVAFQYYGQIYYRAFKAIPPGAELLVYYGKDYARDLGIERVFSGDPKKVEMTQGGPSFRCQECGRLYTIHIYLLKHLKHSHGHAIYFPRESNTPNRGIMSTQGIPYIIGLKRPKTLAHGKQICSSELNNSVHPVKATGQSVSTDKSLLLAEEQSPLHDLSPDDLNGCTSSVKDSATSEFMSDTEKCATCGISIMQRSKLKMSGHADPCVRQCSTCSKSLEPNKDEMKHEQIHSGGKQHVCETCGYASTTSGNLRIHQRIHSGVKPYQCKTCGKAFTVVSKLRVHEMIHSGVKPYQCETCGKAFTHMHHLRRHERIHTGVKPYQCKTCGKAFSQSNDLRKHEQIHSGVKPYQCKTCGKSFAQSGNLRGHERIHTGVKPYQCKTCGKAFTQAGQLRVHELIHFGAEPYQCKTCREAFSQSSDLRRHECVHSQAALNQGQPIESPSAITQSSKQNKQYNEQ